MTTIYLVRHGETQWNREDIFRGRADVPLNVNGKIQAEKLGIALQKLSIDHPLIWTSPMARARETAEIATRQFSDHTVVNKEAFTDISFGDWEGKSVEQVNKKYPELYRTWQENPDEVVFPGGERLEQVADRTETALYEAARIYPEREIILVSHRAVNKTLLCRLLGASLKSFWLIDQDPTCINELRFNGKAFNIVRLNEACHLKD